jgi:hypothetical protein
MAGSSDSLKLEIPAVALNFVHRGVPLKQIESGNYPKGGPDVLAISKDQVCIGNLNRSLALKSRK